MWLKWTRTHVARVKMFLSSPLLALVLRLFIISPKRECNRALKAFLVRDVPKCSNLTLSE
jgi:hypothetical protein